MVNSSSISIEDIQNYLHERIPITEIMKVKVQQAEDAIVRLAASFEPNINHQGTVFGGSASALAILSAWVMLYRRLKVHDFEGDIVIQSNCMNYDKPITGAFTAVCKTPDSEVWEKFDAILKRWNKARIKLKSTLICNGERTGWFEGEYVALGNQSVDSSNYTLDRAEVSTTQLG